MTRPARAYTALVFTAAAAVPAHRAVVALHSTAPGVWMLLLVAVLLAVFVGLTSPSEATR